MGCQAQLVVEHHVLPVVNDPAVAERARGVFTRLVGENELDMSERTMGAEDVGLFMSDVPGMYFFVGANMASRETYYGHHHPRFDFDEAALPLGVALLTAVVADYVLPGAL
jgi:amidohydrolase